MLHIVTEGEVSVAPGGGGTQRASDAAPLVFGEKAFLQGDAHTATVKVTSEKALARAFAHAGVDVHMCICVCMNMCTCARIVRYPVMHACTHTHAHVYAGAHPSTHMSGDPTIWKYCKPFPTFPPRTPRGVCKLMSVNDSTLWSKLPCRAAISRGAESKGIRWGSAAGASQVRRLVRVVPSVAYGDAGARELGRDGAGALRCGQREGREARGHRGVLACRIRPQCHHNRRKSPQLQGNGADRVVAAGTAVGRLRRG